MKKKQLAILTMAALLAAVPASVPVLGAETEETKTESATSNSSSRAGTGISKP